MPTILTTTLVNMQTMTTWGKMPKTPKMLTTTLVNMPVEARVFYETY
jgi:hypothetical protein